MQFRMLTTLVLPLLSLLAAPAFAAPAIPDTVQKDVYAPKVTYPSEGALLIANQTVTITWTGTPPENISSRAMLLLSKAGYTYPFVLAKDFDLRSGSLSVKVPYVFTDEYEFVLFGDSGNYSPTFKIQSDL